MNSNQLNLIKRINAIADTGLLYAEGDYDRERYEELKGIGTELMAQVAEKPLEVLKEFLIPSESYPTPKLDIRGFVINEKDEILMAKESVDSKWTIPGGWADIGSTPSEVAIKEIWEETGMKAEVVRLLAVYDKQVHPHPPEPYYLYKIIFHCQITGGQLKPGFDMLGADFFSLDNLPPLSEERILEFQIKQLFQLAKSKTNEVYFD
ncbi:NUDIX hydrolase [Flagellimonas meridianipacifica]|uniref:ADP-ribose pyrophosphatase YjhB (NUDIX family) n=1 Tax=Flagellimonas meridianipacifica TaxID=1080225 RepID=A0A2T0MGH0_9FLAO|nr:NUDIX hydrolase [Allomuricauda pacifica]PRX56669.1 ADP-ribose pyrophosphatase YjhB (NUDIX family) [Allomuricauda pacifica]